MRRKVVALAAMIAAAFPVLVVPGGAHAAGTHAFWIQGISSIQQTYNYIHGGTRDEVGIPKPDELPPLQTTTPCKLVRNTVVLGATACSGILTHTTLPGNQGCTEAGAPTVACKFTGGTTWFYGFCGQTYGGASGIEFSFSNQKWEITRMGFARGRGGWEFNGVMEQITPTAGAKAYIRMYLAAVPNQPNEAAGCDGVGQITSIYFQGVAIVSDTQLPRVIPAAPGWHWCTGSDGC